MDRALFVACAVVLCALPSAFGLNCTHCTWNLTIQKLCDDPSKYVSGECRSNTSHCIKTELSGTLEGANFTGYILGCFEPDGNETCDQRKNTTCMREMNQPLNDTSITSCMSTCCNDKDDCNMPELPTTSATMSSTESGTQTPGTTPTDAATVPGLVPQLAIVASMAAVYFGVK